MKKLVLVTGSGRSGTSSVSGTLYRFGFYIPEPMVQADEKNPRGYYEPSWVARFHSRWLEGIPVRTIDSRPHAGQVAMDTVNEKREETLRTWVQETLDSRPDGDVVVIKETRAYWVLPLWYRVADAVGADMATLTMLRHPTQVVRSRDTAYLSHKADTLRLQRETTNVAAWMNSVFETERSTRGHQRTFVPYLDFIADWREAMTRACAQIGVDPGDLTAPHDVDDFITSSLNRSSDSWEGLAVPDQLREMADATWAAANQLVIDPADAGAQADLDRLREQYVDLYTTSYAISSDEATAREFAARTKSKRTVERQKSRIEQLEKQVAELEARPQGVRAALRDKLRGRQG